MISSITYQIGIIQVLENFSEGIHYKELTNLLIESGLIVTNGKTPWLTVNSLMNNHIKRKGEQSLYIKHTSKSGRFVLRNEPIQDQYTVIDEKKENKEL